MSLLEDQIEGRNGRRLQKLKLGPRLQWLALEDQSNIKNVIGEEIRVTGQQVLRDNEDRPDLEIYSLIPRKIAMVKLNL
jgi:hypothetical protein